MSGFGSLLLCLVPLLAWTVFIWWLSRFTASHRWVSARELDDSRIPLAAPGYQQPVQNSAPIRRLPR